MNKILLQLLDLVSPLIHRGGVNYSHVRTIVEYKLMMDGRNNSMQYGQQTTTENSKWQLFFIQFWYALIGAVVGWVAIFRVESVFWGGLFIFAYAMMISAMMLLSEFAHNLIETHDNQILLPQPITGQTIYMARMVHIFLYLTRLNLALVGIPFVMAFWGWGIVGAFVFLGLCVLSTVMILAFTGMFYLTVMRFTSPDRFKRIIGTVQVLLNIAFVGGFQLINQLMQYIKIDDTQYINRWWHFLAPPAWMGGLLDLAVNQQPQTELLILALLAVVVPGGCIWATNKYLTPVFTEDLSELAIETTVEKAAKIQVEKEQTWLEKLAQWLTKNPTEEVSFLLSWKLTTRETKFKMRAFPIFGSMIPFLFMIFRDFGKDGAASNRFLVLLYFLPLAMLTFQFQSHFSDSFKSSWMFHGLPIRSPGLLLRGNSKSLIIKYLLPFYVLISAIVLTFFGLHTIDDLLLSWLVTMAFVFAEPLHSSLSLPFSKDPANQAKGGQTALMFTMMFVLMALAGMHWLLTKLTGGVWIGIGLITLMVWWLHQRYEGIGWDKIKE